MMSYLNVVEATVRKEPLQRLPLTPLFYIKRRTNVMHAITNSYTVLWSNAVTSLLPC